MISDWSAYAFVRGPEGQIACVRKTSKATGKPRFWHLPGGKRDPKDDTDWIDTLLAELKEEVGIIAFRDQVHLIEPVLVRRITKKRRNGRRTQHLYRLYFGEVRVSAAQFRDRTAKTSLEEEVRDFLPEQIERIDRFFKDHKRIVHRVCDTV